MFVVKNRNLFLDNAELYTIKTRNSYNSDGTTCPGVDSASKNEYRGFLLGKGGRCVRPTTYHSNSAERQENPGLFRPVAGDFTFSYNLHPPLSHLTKYQKGVHYAGIRVFSHLPTSIKSIANETKMFKKTLKTFLLDNSFYSIDEYFNFKK